jgi:transcriptional regulator with XRE-family HTH domain
MKTTNTNSVNWLEQIFTERKSRNSRYSLRAFSRDINMSHSLLIRIRKGQRSLTAHQAYKIGLALKLTKDELFDLILMTFDEESKTLPAQDADKNEVIL